MIFCFRHVILPFIWAAPERVWMGRFVCVCMCVCVGNDAPAPTVWSFDVKERPYERKINRQCFGGLPTAERNDGVALALLLAGVLNRTSVWCDAWWYKNTFCNFVCNLDPDIKTPHENNIARKIEKKTSPVAVSAILVAHIIDSPWNGFAFLYISNSS